MFVGKLEEVIFYDKDFDGKHLTPNEMVRVDFRQAQFLWVEFRRLNLETVLFPEGDDYLRFEHKFPEAINRVLAAVGSRQDLESRQIRSMFEMEKQWLGPRQRRGVISKPNVRTISDSAVTLVEQAVREFLA